MTTIETRHSLISTVHFVLQNTTMEHIMLRGWGPLKNAEGDFAVPWNHPAESEKNVPKLGLGFRF